VHPVAARRQSNTTSCGQDSQSPATKRLSVSDGEERERKHREGRESEKEAVRQGRAKQSTARRSEREMSGQRQCSRKRFGVCCAFKTFVFRTTIEMAIGYLPRYLYSQICFSGGYTSPRAWPCEVASRSSCTNYPSYLWHSPFPGLGVMKVVSEGCQVAEPYLGQAKVASWPSRQSKTGQVLRLATLRLTSGGRGWRASISLHVEQYLVSWVEYSSPRSWESSTHNIARLGAPVHAHDIPNMALDFAQLVFHNVAEVVADYLD
jgi:hypothetical protein